MIARAQILDGLRALHHGGWVHRDLKFDNIMLHRDESGISIRIADAGLMCAGGVAYGLYEAQVGTADDSEDREPDQQATRNLIVSGLVSGLPGDGPRLTAVSRSVRGPRWNWMDLVRLLLPWTYFTTGTVVPILFCKIFRRSSG